MDNRKSFIFTITAIMVLIILTACDALVTPTGERVNIYDSSNPIPAVVDLNLELKGTNDDRFVELSWSEGTSNVETNMSGFLIVFKPGEAPANIWDGRAFGKADATGGGVIVEDRNVDQASDYPRGSEVFYSIFTYGPKAGESDVPALEVDEGDGAIRNVDYYTFVGPVSGSVIVPITEYIYVAKDGYIDNTDSWFMNAEDLYIESNASSEPITMSFVTFDIADIMGATIISSKMGFTTYSSQTATTDLDVSLMNIEWDGESFANLQAASSYDSNYTVTVGTDVIPDSSPTHFAFDLTEITQLWCSGNKSNYGVRMIISVSSVLQHYWFQSNEHPGDKPELLISYYYE